MPTLAGHLDLTCACDANGCSYLREQSFSAPFHISKPYWDGDALLLQLVSPTPGLFGGDRLTSSVTLDEGARLRIVTPSAGRAHTMNGNGAELRQIFRLAKRWLFPDPIWCTEPVVHLLCERGDDFPRLGDMATVLGGNHPSVQRGS